MFCIVHARNFSQTVEMWRLQYLYIRPKICHKTELSITHIFFSRIGFASKINVYDFVLKILYELLTSLLISLP